MAKYAFWIAILIGLYIVANNYLGVSRVLSALANAGVQGVVALQGRDIKGVTK